MLASLLWIVGCGVTDDDAQTVRRALEDDGCAHPAERVAICSDADDGQSFTLDGAAAHRYAIDELIPARIAKAASDSERIGFEHLRDALAKRLDELPPPVAVTPEVPTRFRADARIRGYQVVAWAHAEGGNQCSSSAHVYGRDTYAGTKCPVGAGARRSYGGSTPMSIRSLSCEVRSSEGASEAKGDRHELGSSAILATLTILVVAAIAYADAPSRSERAVESPATASSSPLAGGADIGAAKHGGCRSLH